MSDTKPSARYPQSRMSDITGDDLRRRLRSIGWSGSDFSRFCGVAYATVYHWLRKHEPGVIPFYVQRLLMIAESDPGKYLLMPDVLPPAKRRRAEQAAEGNKGNLSQDAHA